jgi:hypothetical protein
MSTYCKHGELQHMCREQACRQACWSKPFNYNYIKGSQCRSALAARIADDLHELIGFLCRDKFNYQEEGRTQYAEEIQAMIDRMRTVQAHAEEMVNRS